MSDKEPIASIARRYRDYERWVESHRAEGFKGLCEPYDGCTSDAIDLADHLVAILEGKDSVDRFLDLQRGIEIAEPTKMRPGCP